MCQENTLQVAYRRPSLRQIVFKWEAAKNELNLLELFEVTRSTHHRPPLSGVFANRYCMGWDYNLLGFLP